MEGSAAAPDPGPSRPSRAGRAVPLAIFALALVLRLVFLAAHPRPLASDARDYDELGWTLARTGSYAVDGAPTAYRAPGYPAFVATIYAVAGRHPAAVQIAQAVLDALTAVLLFLLLRRRSRTAAMIAGFAWVLFPAPLLFANDLLSETLFTFLVVAFTAVVTRDRARADLFAGLLLGAMILIKPVALLFAAAMPWALAPRGSRRSTAPILAVALVPVLFWVARNVIVMGTPAIVTSSGANLLIGNNPRANGGYTAPPANAARFLAGNEVEADRIAGGAALAFMASDPWGTLLRGGKKLALLASSEAELAAGVFTRPEPGIRLRDRYAAVPVWLRALVSLPTLAVLIVGIFGIATSRGGTERRLFLALLSAIAISALLFFGGSRFRFPLLPFFVLYGAMFLARPGPALHETSRTRLALAGLACAAVLAVWIAEALVLSQSSAIG